MEKKHICPQCSKVYKFSNGLAKHISKMHTQGSVDEAQTSPTPVVVAHAPLSVNKPTPSGLPPVHIDNTFNTPRTISPEEVATSIAIAAGAEGLRDEELQSLLKTIPSPYSILDKKTEKVYTEKTDYLSDIIVKLMVENHELKKRNIQLTKNISDLIPKLNESSKTNNNNNGYNINLYLNHNYLNKFKIPRIIDLIDEATTAIDEIELSDLKKCSDNILIKYMNSALSEYGRQYLYEIQNWIKHHPQFAENEEDAFKFVQIITSYIGSDEHNVRCTANIECSDIIIDKK